MFSGDNTYVYWQEWALTNKLYDCKKMSAKIDSFELAHPAQLFQNGVKQRHPCPVE